MSHDPHLHQVLLSLRLLLGSLDQISHHVRHLERALLASGAALTAEKEQPETGATSPLPENAETLDALGVELPCRACGVSTRRTVSGQLLDLDGGDHSQTCSLSRVCGNHLDEPKAARTRHSNGDQPAGADPLAARKNSSTSAARKRIERPME